MDNTDDKRGNTQKGNYLWFRSPSRAKKRKRRITKNEKISYTITVLVSLISIAVSTYFVSKYVPEDENKVIQCSKANGKYQKQLMQMPSVAQYLNFLKYIEKKDIQRMWESVCENKQMLWGDKMGMLYQYILTHDYEIKYIIPESETKFHVLLKFTDNVDVSEVSLLKNFHWTKIKDICEMTIPEDLIDEVYAFIEKRFLIEPDYTKDSVRNYIKDYMLNMTMHDFVIQDWRFPVNIASQLQLQLMPTNKLGYYSNMQSHEMLCFVEMEYDAYSNQWKVKTFTTEAISRW